MTPHHDARYLYKIREDALRRIDTETKRQRDAYQAYVRAQQEYESTWIGRIESFWGRLVDGFVSD